jgi:predicted ATPase
LEGIRLKGSADKLTDYPFSIPSIKKLGLLMLHKPVSIFLGENGSGKSTLLEGIAKQWGLNSEGGSRNFFFSPETAVSGLHQHLTLIRGSRRANDSFFLRAESYYRLAIEVDSIGIADFYGGKSLNSRSHGEGFWAILNSRFFGPGLYIMDEPEAALSPTTQLAVIRKINELASRGSQFIIATHSPILLGYPDADLYEMGAAGIRKTRYEETEHYVVTSEFIRNRNRLIAELFKDDS